FDKIIAATNDHFWDPMDPKYVDFSAPFDLKTQLVMPESLNLELRTAVADKLDEGQKIRLVNGSVHFVLSGILHGEQAALSLSADLCHILLDPGAQEYAANQAREEARHVTGFTNYIKARWGKPTVMDPFLMGLINEMVYSPLVWKKIVGLQMVLEGLAMGLFSNFYQFSQDPVLKQLLQFTMTDEAFHHKFGKIWADKTVPHLPEKEREQIEDWAWTIFSALLKGNSFGFEHKNALYTELGLDWKWVQGAVMEAMADKDRRAGMAKSTNVFRSLIKTLIKSGIVTQRTAPNYAAFVDLKELHAEGDAMVGDEIAEEGIKFLKAINEGRDPRRLAAAE
ncbi:MAG TPA: ferritin-like domain-containing protein, partial [Alphaproteobacteria bacterium]|nr:ferritin-like domain-containing protein [Alphaproteobacteria bacterium]